MIAQGHKPGNTCSPLFAGSLIFVFFAFSIFACAADDIPANAPVEFTPGINETANLLSGEPGGNEARMVITKDGEVISEVTLQLDEVDIIVQFDEEPVLTQKSVSSADKMNRLETLRLKSLPLKSRIIEAENAILQQNGRASRPAQDIIKREFHGVFNGVAARVQKDVIRDIEKMSGVRKVWRDGQVKALDDSSNQVIGAPQVWNGYGIRGSGIVVAILDTGIDYRHPDLGGCLGPACRVISGYDFVNNDADPMDDHGHGTHCAGIVAANGQLHGVAPEAKLLAGKVLNSSGSGSWSGIIAGIEWATDPDGMPATDDGADVISMSLGGSGTPDDPISQAVDNAVSAGVVVVVAAGNAGPKYESVQSPGVARKAITVGATDNYDQLASFSSRGPVPGTWQMKPEVTAPGVSIISTYLNGSYSSMSGTSMATPHVAGAAALLRQRYPSADPQWIKDALMQKAANLGLNAFSQGSGRINVYASVSLSATASMSALSLGVDDKSQSYFTRTQSLALTNKSTGSKTYTIGVTGSLPPGVTTAVTPSSLTLAPGETKSFTFNLGVDNSVTPDSMTTLDLAQPYDFEGRIVATATTDSVGIGIPFTFFKAPTLTVHFGSTPWIVMIHASNGGSVKMSQPTGDYTSLVPVGSFNVITWFSSSVTDVQEHIQVTSSRTISSSAANAIYPLQIIPTGADGGLVNVQRGLQMRYFEIKESGWSVGISAGATQGIQYFSPMSDDYIFEMSMFVNPYPVPGPSYMFHMYAKDGVYAPATFQNTAADFKHVINRHHIDTGLTYAYPTEAIALRWPSGGSTYTYYNYSCSDAPLAPPFQEESYLLPPPYPEFHTGYIRKMVYGSTSTSRCSGSWPLQHVTPLLRAKDSSEIDGSWYYSYFPTPHFSSSFTVLDSGIGPYSWYGRFQNYSTLIYLNWDYDYPFASQSRDERPPTASASLPYELYRDGALVQSGSFSGNYGYISLASAKYTLKLIMNNFTVNGNPGSATVNATFDLRLPDTRPPLMTQLKLSKNGQPTDFIAGGELLQFDVRDEDSGLKAASLLFDRGDGWAPVPLSNPSANIYQATLPVPLTHNSPASLRIEATDNFENILQFETQVATSSYNQTYSAPSDFDGDGVSDMAVFRPDSGVWFVLPSQSPDSYNMTHWGTASDALVPAKYDGDAKTDFAVRRPANGVWYALTSSVAGNFTATPWGTPSDIAVQGDYDGDGKADIAVWRPGTGVWYLLLSGTPGSYTTVRWGTSGDIPVPGDYDGDGKTDIAVRRPDKGTWYILKSGTPGSYSSTQWGLASDLPTPADFDADGKTDIGVWRPGTGTWYILPSSTSGYTATRWGTNGDRPIAGDYDGDGKSDIGVWRPGSGVWFILPSGTPGSYIARPWGTNGDVPISSLTGILGSIP